MEPEVVWEEPVQLEGAVAVQVRRVLRLRPGEEIALFCGDGWEHRVRLTAVEERHLEGRIEERRQPDTEPRASVWLAIALLKGEKLEWVIQKGTELGVSGFLLMRTQHTTVTADDARCAARLDRYRRIAIEAAEQCGRVRVPEIEGPISFADALTRATGFDYALLAHERAHLPLPHALLVSTIPASPAYPLTRTSAPSLLLFIGPEGGFPPDEVGTAAAAGVTAVSLGPRILRAETAALAVLALCLPVLEASV